MVPQDVQQFHSPPMPGSRSPFHCWVSPLQGVTHGVTRPPSATLQATPSGSQRAASPTRLAGVPPGLGTALAGRPRRNQGRAHLTDFKGKVSVGARTHQGPQPSPCAPAPSTRQGDPDAVAAARGPFAPFSRRPAASPEAPIERRGRKPPLASDCPTRSPARHRSAAKARPRRRLVRCSAPALQEGTARAGTFFRSFAAAPPEQVI
ncbi:hypothetical protein NDU88_005464 [Pleurodeles waltl]|uniref:Uncharacterized protein n=1 Tax=Pleurodeles waltl TaxID=8319 RepID=A0AAV7LU62_PLEWA|nr:hypothetical protein NDU88_005464 [Pleurodeles waltl]